jgi:hypothetical protein
VSTQAPFAQPVAATLKLDQRLPDSPGHGTGSLDASLSEGDQIMRRYQKWLSVGLIALTPGAAMAGLLDGSPASKPSATTQVAERPARKSQKESNQELAERVGKALEKTRIRGYDVQIDVQEGRVTLDGVVASREQQQAAAKACQSVPGVKGVYNRLRVGEPAVAQGPIQQTTGTMPRRTANPNAVRQANYQSGLDSRGTVQQVAAYQGTPPANAPPAPNAPLAIPAYGPPDGMGGHTIYNQPNLPNYAAWPSYAQYPNYAAIQYPSQYSASAWPYIGPFYPYPQVPLNWRKATLEWREGNWDLRFDNGFNRWCWFLDPHNW